MQCSYHHTRSENEAFETAKIVEKHGAETIVFQADVCKGGMPSNGFCNHEKMGQIFIYNAGEPSLISLRT